LIRDLLASVATESVGAVAGATGRSGAGAPLALELLALPLAHRGGASTRILGALVPTEVPYWLGAEALGSLILGTTRYLGPLTGPYAVPRSAPAVPSNARVRHGLLVYDGGHA
jgi:hypothetical protein